MTFADALIFIVICSTTPSVSHAMCRRIVEWFVNIELGRLWKEVVVAHLKYYSCGSPEKMKKSTRNLVRIFCVLTEIRIAHFTDTHKRKKHCHLRQLARFLQNCRQVNNCPLRPSGVSSHITVSRCAATHWLLVEPLNVQDVSFQINMNMIQDSKDYFFH